MQLKEFLKKQNTIPSELIEIVDQLFDYHVFDEHEYLLKIGEISDKIYFIESGVVREFAHIESEFDSETDFESKKAVTYWILPENE